MDTKATTDIHWKTLNPVWEEEFVVRCPRDRNLTEIRFQVWDKNRLGSSDFIGSAQLTRKARVCLLLSVFLMRSTTVIGKGSR